MKNIILIFWVLLLVSCDKSETVPSEEPGSEISYTLVYQNTLSSTLKNMPKGLLVINNDSDWQKFKTDLNTERGHRVSDDFSTDTIDFSKNTVLFVLGNLHPSVASIDVKKISKNGTTITLKVFEQNGMLHMLSHPFLIAKIPKTNDKVILTY